MPKPRIAFLTPVDPFPGDSGGKQVSATRLSFLSEIGAVDLLTLGPPQQGQGMESSIHHLASAGHLRPRSAIGLLSSYLSGLPISVWRNAHPDFLQAARHHSSIPYGLVYIDHWLMWPAAACFKGKRILNLHNAEHLLFSRSMKGQSFLMRSLLALEYFRVKNYLRRICSLSEQVHVLSPADAQELVRIGVNPNKIHVYFPQAQKAQRPFGRFGRDLLFAGTLSWPPNKEGLDWFFSEVAPRIQSRLVLRVIGSDGGQDFKIPASRLSVLFEGRVESLDDHYDQACIFIAPLLTGSGIKMKIVNALMRGIPVVTTSIGIEGFPEGWQRCVKVSDDPGGFASDVENLTQDPLAWAAFSKAARAYAIQHFESSSFLADMAKQLEQG